MSCCRGGVIGAHGEGMPRPADHPQGERPKIRLTQGRPLIWTCQTEIQYTLGEWMDE